MDFPTPGSPANKIAAPGTSPPPKTRSNSLTPLDLARAFSRFTSPIGWAAVVTLPGTSESFLGAEISSTLPHVWHSPQRPTHLVVLQPHSLQRNGSFVVVVLAMARDYRERRTNGRLELKPGGWQIVAVDASSEPGLAQR